MNSTTLSDYATLIVFIVSWEDQCSGQCCPAQGKSLTLLIFRIMALTMINSFTNECDETKASPGELVVTFHSPEALPSRLTGQRPLQVPGSPQECLSTWWWEDHKYPKKMVKVRILSRREWLFFPSCFRTHSSHRAYYRHDTDGSSTDLWLIGSARVFLIDETVNTSFCSVWMYSTL